MKNYDGTGFVKILKGNFSENNFFRKMIKKEVIEKNWTRDPATMAILLEF